MTTDAQSIRDGSVVQIHFKLTTDSGQEIESTEGSEPMLYLHGANNLMPALEAHLTGLTAGKNLDVTLAPEDGFGERSGDGPQAWPRTAFPAEIELVPGMQFTATAENGADEDYWVLGTEDEMVYVDTDHPLAGESLRFVIEVISVRAATEEEVAHGHPHGLDGHAAH